MLLLQLFIQSLVLQLDVNISIQYKLTHKTAFIMIHFLNITHFRPGVDISIRQ